MGLPQSLCHCHQSFPEGPLELFACLLAETPSTNNWDYVTFLLGPRQFQEYIFYWIYPSVCPSHTTQPGSYCQIPPTCYVNMLLHRKIKGRNKLESLWNTPLVKFHTDTQIKAKDNLDLNSQIATTWDYIIVSVFFLSHFIYFSHFLMNLYLDQLTLLVRISSEK